MLIIALNIEAIGGQRNEGTPIAVHFTIVGCAEHGTDDGRFFNVFIPFVELEACLLHLMSP